MSFVVKRFFGKGTDSLKDQIGRLGSANGYERRRAVHMLSGLARNPEHRERIVALGGIRRLVSLLSDEDVQVREDAAATLWSLAFNNSHNSARIVEAGAMRPLVSLLSDRDTDVRRWAAGVMQNLAADHRERIAEAEGIKPLVALLSDRDTVVRQNAADLLWTLAASNQNQERIAKAGGIRPLISLLSDGDVVVRQKAAGTLWSLAENNENQQLIAETGSIRPLVSLLSDVDAVVRQNAAGTLRNLAVNHLQNRERIAEAGAIRPLVSLMSDRDIRVRKNAAEALSQMVAHHHLLFDLSLINALKTRFEAEEDNDIKSAVGYIIDECERGKPKDKPKKIATVLVETNPFVEEYEPSKPKKITTVLETNPFVDECERRNSEQMETILGTHTASSDQTEAQIHEIHLEVVQAQEVQSCETVQLASLALESSPCVQPSSPLSSPVVGITKVVESQVKLGRLLGEGSFGKVYEADYNHQKVAVKKYVCAQIRRNELNGIYREILLMQQLDQKYLVRLLGIIETAGSPPSLVMEYGEKGSLYAYLGESENIPWTWRLRTAEELARGLAYLHGKNIQHRDIKSLNVVLDEDLHAKWCDFGLSLLKEHATATQTHQAQSVGTTRWMAPELFEDEPPETKKSDVWSYGMVLFELATQSIPYKKLNNTQVLDRLKQHKSETVPEEYRTRVPRFASLMESCWKVWSERPEASELVRVLSEMRSESTEPSERRNSVELASDFIGLSMK